MDEVHFPAGVGCLARSTDSCLAQTDRCQLSQQPCGPINGNCVSPVTHKGIWLLHWVAGTGKARHIRDPGAASAYPKVRVCVPLQNSWPHRPPVMLLWCRSQKHSLLSCKAFSSPLKTDLFHQSASSSGDCCNPLMPSFSSGFGGCVFFVFTED